MTTAHIAEISRDGRWWMIKIPEISGLTQARRFSEIERMARELVAVTLDVRMSEVAVELRFDIPGVADLQGRVDKIRAEKAEAARLEADAVEESRRVAQELVDAEVPLRDAGEILGVSYQRVHQLVS
ncbi:hypothetical protein [Microlunatus sp. GCM10028923]|uniref:hypothetical protein n=1 Tax=Microlunatus sp. GCM10028923 TaxID=3273400 RepID=UPI003621277F